MIAIMISPAEKITRSTTTVQRKAAGNFFDKAGGESFFTASKTNSFFQAPVQAKLSVSSPDDPQEKEADAVADKVMRMPEPAVLPQPLPAKEENLQRKEEEEIQAKQETPLVEKIQCKEEPEEKLQAKLEDATGRINNHHGVKNDPGFEAGDDININRKNSSLYQSDIIQRYGRGPPQCSSSFQQNLIASKGSGNALPENTRAHMESRFNADFSNVRVHTNSGAEHMNNQVQAKAFTHGNDIYFNKGNYAPGTSHGNLLLAHELTHTIQQGASSVHTNVNRKSLAGGRSNLYRSTSVSPHLAAGVMRQAASPAANASATEADSSALSGGYALPSEAREYFQSSFKTDVGDIKIHSDFQAAALCMSRHVTAFTQGEHIFFAPGRYSATTQEGGILLARQISDSLVKRSIIAPGMAARLNAGISQVKAGIPTSKPKSKAARPVTDLSPKGKKKSGVVKENKGKKDKGAAGKHKGKKKGDSDGRAFPVSKPRPNKSPSTPAEDPAFHKAVAKSKAASKQQKKHEPADSKANDAQNAATAVPKEAESHAQDRKAGGMDEAGKKDTPFDSASFIADLSKKIDSVTPHSLEEADDFKNNDKVAQVKNAMGQKVGDEKENSTGPVSQATSEPLQVNEADNKQPVPLPPTVKGALPGGPSPTDAAPKAKLNNEISLQEKSSSLDEEMKANNVTEDQLSKSNEPDFKAALNEKQGAQKDALQRPVQYRKDEDKQLAEAKSSAQAVSTQSLNTMNATRGKNFDTVVQQQQTTKQKDEEKRANVSKTIEQIYQAAEQKVNDALKAADTESARIFDQGSQAAQNTFENEVAAKMDAYKDDRYSGVFGGLRWLDDKLTGMPDKVNEFYEQGRQHYLDMMNAVITEVANVVTAKLNEAKQAIKDGKKAIDDYVKQLPADLADVGKEAASNIQDKFDSLELSVNDKRDQLIDGLAKKYVDNVKKLDDRISEMKEANEGLIDKAVGMLKKVWKVINDLKNLFTTILAKLASIIGVILNSPSGFFNNLARAFKMGLDNFKNNFLQYLEKGLMDWLVTNLGIAGIEIPEKFDAAALFTLALQVMGITKDHVRKRAVAVLDEEKVSLLENAGGLLYRVFNEGLHVIWDMIVEKLTDFKDLVWEAIKSFIQKSIIEAAITFVLSMLSPIGAFIKVCMAIYDFLMMLVKFKDRIMELLDTILNAVTNIATGAVDGAVKAIEGAFAKSIPVIIGFLAALLHLNGIVSKVRDIILRIQSKVEKAIDWVIGKAWSVIGSTVEGALRIKQKGKAMLEKGKQAVIGAGKKAVGAVVGWLGIRKAFTNENNENHSVFFEDSGKLMIASEPVDVNVYLANQQKQYSQNAQMLQIVNDAILTVQNIDIKKTKLQGSKNLEANQEASASVFRELDVEISKLVRLLSKLGGNLKPSGRYSNPLDAIPMTWHKPLKLYPQSIILNGEEYSLYEEKPLRIPRARNLANVRKDAGDIANEEITIGISPTSTNAPVIGKVWFRNQVGRIRGGVKQEQFRGLLAASGFNWGNMEADHIRDLQWGGQDAYSNLWPLNKSYNNAANQILNQNVTYENASGNVVTEPLDNTPLNLYFRIKNTI